MKREPFLGTMQFACPVQRLKDSFRQDLSKSAMDPASAVGLKHVREGFIPRVRKGVVHLLLIIIIIIIILGLWIPRRWIGSGHDTTTGVLHKVPDLVDGTRAFVWSEN